MPVYVCRFCCNQKNPSDVDSNKVFSIFSAYSLDTNKTAAEMVTACASVTVMQDDRLPTVICLDCLVKLQIAYDFHKTALQSQRALENQLQSDDADWKNVNDVVEYTLPSITIQTDRETFTRRDVKVNEEITAEFNEPKKSIKREERPFVCAFCAKSFKYSTHLREHENSHKYGSYLLCVHCGKSFTTTSALNIHVHRKHETISDDQNEIQSLKTLTTDTVTELFERLNAENRLHDTTYLNASLKTHKACPFCSVTYRSHCLLARHLRTHFDYRPFVCKVCNVTFKLKCNLIAHETAHEYVKRRKCGLCKRGFTRFDSLRKHELTVHGRVITRSCRERQRTMDIKCK